MASEKPSLVLQDLGGEAVSSPVHDEKAFSARLHFSCVGVTFAFAVNRDVEETSPWTGEIEPESVGVDLYPACSACFASLHLDPWVRAGCSACGVLKHARTDYPRYSTSEYQLAQASSGSVIHVEKFLKLALKHEPLDALAREMLVPALAKHLLAFMNTAVTLGEVASAKERTGEWRVMRSAFLAATPQLQKIMEAIHD